MTRAGAGPARASSPHPVGTARGSLTVAGWTTVSRVTGLLRVVAVGAVFGPTWFANVFQSTNQVPNLLYEVMAGPVLALVVVPAVVRARAPGSAVDHRHLVDGLTGLLLAAAGVLALVIVLAAPAAAWVFTSGVDDPATQERAFRLAVLLLWCVAPQVPLYTLAYLGAAAQQARQRFALAAAAPAVENLALVAVVGAIAAVAGPGTDVGTASLGTVLALGVGATAAVALHAGLQCWGAARAGTTVRPRWRRHDPEVAVLVRRLRGSVRVAALPAAGVFVLLAVASTVPGGVTVFWLAYCVGAVPTALGARAVATAVLPGLSRAAHDDDAAAFARGWRQGSGYAAFVGVGAAVVLVVLAGPLAAVLAAGELRTPEVVASLTVCVAVIGISQVFGGAYEIGRQALFARLDVRGARFATDVGTVLGAAVGVAALAAAPGLRPALLCLAVLVRDAGSTVLVLARLRRTVPGRSLVAWPALAAVLVGVAVAVPVALVARAVLTGLDVGEVLAVVALGGAGLLVVGVYAVALRETWRRVGRWTGRSAW